MSNHITAEDRLTLATALRMLSHLAEEPGAFAREINHVGNAVSRARLILAAQALVGMKTPAEELMQTALDAGLVE